MRRLLLSALPLLASLLLAGCGSTPATSDKVGKVYQRESFAAEETFSRLFDANVDATCEAARRAQEPIATGAGKQYVLNALQNELLPHVSTPHHGQCLGRPQNYSS